MMRRIVTTALSTVSVVLSFCLALAPAASAEERPWWHLATGSRPAYLKAGLAHSEVQEILTTQGEFASNQVTNFVLSVNEERLEEFATEPVAKEFGLPLPTPANIQSALEKAYGVGNVTVKEETTEADGKPLAEGAKRYLVTSIAAKADQIVSPIQARPEVGTAQAKVATPGRPDGELYLTAENIGNASISGADVPVVLSDALPPGLRAVDIAATKPQTGDFARREPLPCSIEESGTRGSCTLKGPLPPFDRIEMRIAVVVEGLASGAANQASVSGGEGFLCEAPGVGHYSDSGCIDESGSGVFERVAIGPVSPASTGHPLTLSSLPVPFGVESYELGNEEYGGAPATQAGAHPFQQTTSITLNQGADIGPLENAGHKPHVNPAALAKDVHFHWPPGLIGNPSAFQQCTDEQFFRSTAGGTANLCPSQSAVGVAQVTLNEPSNVGVIEIVQPLFNLKPHVGEPARFGFNVIQGNVPVVIDTAVRTGGDYGITVSADNITQTSAFLSSAVTVWGVPGDPRHDRQRGWACLFESRGVIPAPRSAGGLGSCEGSGEQHPPPFLSLPTSCTGPLKSSVQGDSWSEPGAFATLAEDTMPAQDGCNRLPFSAEIRLAPDGQQASTPTGLTVDVHVPQEEDLNSAGLASSNIRDIDVLFPEGVVLNPAAADGLQACSEDQIGYLPAQSSPPIELHFTEKLPEPLLQSVNFCPDAAKVGTVKIKTPLLPNPLEGALYLASPAPNGEDAQNPFRTLLAAYIVAKDPVSGALVKLPGKVILDQQTGRLDASFENNPQLAFEDAEIHLFGGARAPLATPAACGTYTTEATFTPWSASPPIKSSSSFQITQGPNGGPCPDPVPFAPTLATGSPNINAGSFSALTTTISREDGNQDINNVQLRFAPGMSGILAGVPLCPEAQANAGTCDPASQIGETIVSVGLGGDPFTVTGGKVYLTEKYQGAPFGLSIVNPADAGPFHLGKVIVRAKIEVDPLTAALTVTTGTIPHILDGIPLQIKHVNVNINRPGFTFNPTNCNPLGISGTIGSAQGASAPVSTAFQVTNCAALKFTPKFSVSTGAHTSKANGASLTAKLSEPNEPFGSQANIARVKVELPKQLPSRLTTLQKACINAQFETNPAGCPAASNIGHAKVTTPLLPVPLEGPAIFVSHGGEAFPSLTMVLQGYGVTVDLVGTTFINKAGVTSTTFKAVPDVPFNTFELTLPTGKFSALTALGSVCNEKLTMPTEFTAQNGMTLHHNTNVAVTGCPKKKALTRAQKLALALKICHKKHNHAKRVACERAAHRKYGVAKQKSKKRK